jgi:iron(III) transport system ATP-binding protein
MIEIKGLSKDFGQVKVLDGLNLDAHLKSYTGILGPSGSGKTTLLRLIAGLEKPDRGEIFINGALASSDDYISEPHSRGIGFVFQVPALWPHMTVWQNIAFGLQGRSKTEVRDRINNLLSAASLKGLERRYPHQLSGGEARRVSLARTLAPAPRYILMDEPLINVDFDLKQRLMQMIKKEIDTIGACLVYVSHDHEELKEISGRIFKLGNGKLEIVEKESLSKQFETF